MQEELDRYGPAVLGALIGLMGGFMYEFSEAFLRTSYELEPIWEIVAEILAATAGGGLLGFIAGLIQQRLRQAI